MRKKIALFFISILFLTSCSSIIKTKSLPTNTPNPTSTVTETLIPTATATPTATPIVIPEFMNEFISLGYDKQPLDSPSIYVVLDENSTYYPTDKWGGIKYKNSIIYGWSKVYYIKNGLLQTAFVILNLCNPHPTISKNYFCYFTIGDNISNANDPPSTTTWTKAIFNDIRTRSVGDFPLVRLEFVSEHFDARNNFSNFPNYSFWETVYPSFNGSFSTFEIPNIGTFLPATYIGYDFSEGKWINP